MDNLRSLMGKRRKDREPNALIIESFCVRKKVDEVLLKVFFDGLTKKEG